MIDLILPSGGWEYGGAGMPKIGWGAVVIGDITDLESWAHALKEQFDPWVETHGTDTVLRSALLDELDSAIEVRDRSTTLIERLNGAMALSRGSKPVRLYRTSLSRPILRHDL
jgi:hypothetical protein